MSRHPWRTRAGLLALVNALAGVGLALGFAAEVGDPFTSVAVAVAAALADLGILRDGESETTPVGDPLGPDGLPLVSWGQVEQMLGQARGGGGLSDAKIEELFDEPNGAAHTERGSD